VGRELDLSLPRTATVHRGLAEWRPRTKIKHLVSLGVSLEEAIKTGVSSKGPYAMSRTPIPQTTMSNDWLTAQGLVSIKEQRVRFHTPASTA